MTQKYTEAKAKANKKWDEANKERKRYINYRSTSRNFIIKYATIEDLKEFESLIERRKNDLNKKGF